MAKREESATIQFKVRMKEALRARLEEEAGRRGISIAQEIVDRLTRSFDMSERLEDVFGSREVYALMRAVGSAMDMTGKAGAHGVAGKLDWDPKNPGAWLSDPYAYDQAVKAAAKILEAMRPEGDPSPPALPTADDPGGPNMELVADVLGTGVGVGMAIDLAREDDVGGPRKELVDALRRDLGEEQLERLRRWNKRRTGEPPEG